jgi:hypothetical protein
MTSYHQREVLGLGQGYSAKIWSDKDLRLALLGGKYVRLRKKAPHKSGSETTMQT